MMELRQSCPLLFIFVGKGAVALQCNGTLSGIRNLYIIQTREVQLHRNSRTSGGNARPGTFLFSNVKLYSGSSVTMEDEIEMKIIVGFLNVKFHAKIGSSSLRRCNFQPGRRDWRTG